MNKINIILILVDALRARSLSCYGYENKVSGTIDDLAKKGVLFENCFTCSNASDPALTSLMSGMLTRSHGILHHSYKVDDSELKTFEERKVRLLQQVLQDNGYNTFGLDFLARWHMRGYDYYSSLKIDRTKRKKYIKNISRLFEAVRLEKIFNKLHKSKIMRSIFGGFDSYPTDSETTEKAIELIAQQKNPYFLFTHFWGVHKSMSASEIQPTVEGYDNAIVTVDDYIKQIVNAASKNTLIIVTGDHGESLGEHGIYFDHHGLYDTTLHVPLIMSGASIPSGKRIKGLVSNTDVFATILSLAEVDYDAKTDSMDLSPYFTKENNSIRNFVYAEENYYQDKACIRTEKYKFIKTIGRKV